jgi:type I restriction enzyme S subunit
MTSLQDISLLITDGKHGDCLDENNSGFFFVSCKDVKDGWIDYTGARQITEADFLDAHKRTQLEANDIVFTNSGTIGRMAIIPNSPETKHTTFQKSVAIVKPNQEKVLPRWLFYSLLANRDTLIALASGTAQKNLLLRDMRALTVEVPPLPIQQKIAAILSTYDDLIENNTRRIKILEEMAQTLYREWFVNFRYPGHEGVPLVESTLGMIPEGWEVVKIGQAFDTMGGGTPSTKEETYWANPDVYWFTPSDLTKSKSMFVFDTEKKISQTGLRNSSAKLFPPYSVMMTSRATIGVVSINIETACTNQGFITCIPNEKASAYEIYYWILNHLELIDNTASGSTYKEINRTEFRDFDFLIAEEKTRQEFLKTIKPIAELIEVLLKKNKNLRKQRDLLLPRLISGELDVENIDLPE